MDGPIPSRVAAIPVELPRGDLGFDLLTVIELIYKHTPAWSVESSGTNPTTSLAIESVPSRNERPQASRLTPAAIVDRTD